MIYRVASRRAEFQSFSRRGWGLQRIRIATGFSVSQSRALVRESCLHKSIHRYKRALQTIESIVSASWRMKRKYPESRWKYRIYVKVFRYRNRIVHTVEQFSISSRYFWNNFNFLIYSRLVFALQRHKSDLSQLGELVFVWMVIKMHARVFVCICEYMCVCVWVDGGRFLARRETKSRAVKWGGMKRCDTRRSLFRRAT